MSHANLALPRPMPWAASPSVPRLRPPRDADWQAVRIARLEVEPDRRATAPGYYHVRTVICLGALTPADVLVQLLPADALMADGATAPIERLWSVRSLSNGAYVFEARVPTALLTGPRRLLVHVGPAGEPAGARLAGPVGCSRPLPAVEPARAG